MPTGQVCIAHCLFLCISSFSGFGLLDSSSSDIPDYLTENGRGVGVDLYSQCLFISFILLHSSSSISDHYLQNKTNSTLSNSIDRSEINTLVSVEVDLREGSERTVHWFVNEKQQKPFMVNVPPSVQFAVCFCLSLF